MSVTMQAIGACPVCGHAFMAAMNIDAYTERLLSGPLMPGRKYRGEKCGHTFRVPTTTTVIDDSGRFQE
jgi:hypothetical protein